MKIQINNLPVIDFEQFMSEDDGFFSVDEYVRLLKGETVETENYGTLDADDNDIYDMAMSNLAALVDKFTTPCLKGWGGREIVAYRDAFLAAIGVRFVPAYLYTENTTYVVYDKNKVKILTPNESK